MEWMSRLGQTLGGIVFFTAFMSTVLRPEWAWYALPLYLIASALFLAVIFERRRRNDN